MTSRPDRLSHHRARLLVVLGVVATGATLSAALPQIGLNTPLAEAAVTLTDTATWPQVIVVIGAVLLLLATRNFPSLHSRGIEVAAAATAILVVLGGSAMVNEHVVKPSLAVPRPNIVLLAESGALGPSLPNAEAFYASGSKGARRIVLLESISDLESPELSTPVLAHWIHETGYSFPSGHTAAASAVTALTAAFGLTALVGWRRFVALVLLPAWAVAVAFTRVLLQVHSPVDVIAGSITGFLWGLLAFALTEYFVRRSKVRRGELTPS